MGIILDLIYDNLPVIFVFLMGFSVLVYVILDGYDLGVGMLLSFAENKEQDLMVSSIAPFWDANETWLVLSVGILLVAFPVAHGQILTALYIPTAIMINGLILRGVSFDFRVKAKDKHKKLWDKTFMFGSLLTAVTQGYMLGIYILGFNYTWQAQLFATMVGGCLAAGYVFIGACWLIIKTEDELQKKAVQWAKKALWGVSLGMILVSAATPLVSARIWEKWFTIPNFFFLLPIPLITAWLIWQLHLWLNKLPLPQDRYCWLPFAGAVVLFLLGFYGIAYSFYPYIIPDKMDIWQAASSFDSLLVILIGVVIVLPFIAGYTLFSYRIFWGKAKLIRY
jgi:cytochrome d ubiquinol oxidase subunit II